MECVRRKVKCAPLKGSKPPYECQACVDAGYKCVPSKKASSSSRKRSIRAITPPPSAADIPPIPDVATTLAIPPSLLSGVAPGAPDSPEFVHSMLFWRAEYHRSLAGITASTGYAVFVRERYLEYLGYAVAPPLPSPGRPAKRARIEEVVEDNVKVTAQEEDAMEEDEVIELSTPADVVEGSSTGVGVGAGAVAGAGVDMEMPAAASANF